MRKEKLSPSKLNAAARLLLVAERCGSEALDNSNSFYRMTGISGFAKLDSDVLDFIRGIVKTGLDGVSQPRINTGNTVKNMS
jgi:hypothetical protein